MASSTGRRSARCSPPMGSSAGSGPCSRSLTYRAIDQLVERRLVMRRGTAQGRGRERSLLRATSAGRQAARAWLDRPVAHLRDVRTELLVKLALRQRTGMPCEDLLRRQRDQFGPVIDSLTTLGDDGDAVARWRAESARAVRRFLDAELYGSSRRRSQRPPTTLRLSARNQISATVERITHGDVMSVVHTGCRTARRSRPWSPTTPSATSTSPRATPCSSSSSRPRRCSPRSRDS